jgi:hypothetical protein
VQSERPHVIEAECFDGHIWTPTVSSGGVVVMVSRLKPPAEHDARHAYRSGRANNKNAHIPLRCQVFDEGMKDKPLAVMTYITNVEGNPPPERRDRKAPSKEYKNRLVDGAKHWRLPETYVEQLEAIETVE